MMPQIMKLVEERFFIITFSLFDFSMADGKTGEEKKKKKKN